MALDREVEGDLFLHDIGQGFGFRPGSFDGAIRCASLIFPWETVIDLQLQYFSHTVALERRDIAPDILAATPPQQILHDATLCSPKPLSCRPPILPIFRRSNSAHHIYRAKGGVRGWCGCRLPKLEESQESVLVPICW